jgi:N utilization substance protein A
VKKAGHRVKILLSRTHSNFVRQLFELEVPEIPEKIVEIKGLVREAGYRTKIAVFSEDPNVDCVGACVGVRGTRIKNIVDELNGEKIDIIRWDEEQEVFIPNTLKPAEVTGILLSPENQVATVVVPNDQLSLAIGKRGQNVRLASKLAGWDIDIITEVELEREREREESGGSSDEDAGEIVSSEDDAGSEVEEASLAEDAGGEEVEK